MGKTIQAPSILKQALTVNKKPFPWLKAFLAGIAAGLPIFIGLLFGSLEYGLIAGLGGFTYLYVFPIPYALLAKKLFWAVIGITSSVFLGTILAPYPIIVAIVMGLIGAIAVFIFGAFRFIGPSAIFFVLIFAMCTGMSVAPDEAFLRAGLAFLGGALSWFMAMSGYLVNPHGPEKRVVKRSLVELADYLDAIGTASENETHNRVMATLKEAGQTLAEGYNAWRTSELFKRLYSVNHYANKIFLIAAEQLAGNGKKVSKQLGESLRNIAQQLDNKQVSEITLTQPDELDEVSSLIGAELIHIKESLLRPSSLSKEQLQFSTPTTKRILLGAFDKNSIILINALRFGMFTTFAAIIAYEFDLNRSFWVPLSCVAVLSGATVVATFHRAIQRSLGTIFGILLASVILAFHPEGLLIALLVFLLTFITELFIVKNYGLAALFFTPSALIMAEAGSTLDNSVYYFASTRLIDVLIGVSIGLLGVWLVGRTSASSRLPHFISKTIRSQAQVMFVLFSNQPIYQNYGKNIEFNKMDTNLKNLVTLYDTATGEIPKDEEALQYYWPIVHSLEELGFLLDKCARLRERPSFNDEQLAQLLLLFETMANAVERKTKSQYKAIPEMKEYPAIYFTLEELQRHLVKN
ncbi:FUSC family protein [Lysinibacillus antri]|uniref:FUSC family protein n=1 Tax=Lysinibacillus antri TaxID=2498145 RepID=A0A3S0R8P0_9BACI|nr:FUSC family protein [Lysinibacillus antri]RUL56895.1 FUSC family protein [Lysinibacillus antri]